MTIDGFEDVPENDEAALQKAVAKQPVSVAICASSGLQFYSSGVMEKGCCTELDHGVLAVGYDVVSMLLYQVTKIVHLQHGVSFMCLNVPCIAVLTFHGQG